MSLMALSLERSKAAPLQLRLTMDDVTPESGFRELMEPYIGNIEILWFAGFATTEDLARTLPNFPQSTPNLRSLELSIDGSVPGWEPSIDPFASFPDTLRSLELIDAPLYPSFLKLRTLTELSLHFYVIHSSMSTLLDLLEENRSLESVEINISIDEFPAHVSQPRVVTLNQLQRLMIACRDPMIARTMIASIPLRRGVHLGLELREEDSNFTLNSILSGISMSHLSNLSSPTFMEYQSSPAMTRLVGPNGSLSYKRDCFPSYGEGFPTLPVADIKELHLIYDTYSSRVPHPSSFLALEALAIKWAVTDVSRIFSTLFPNPSFFPSLRTLGFLDCNINEGFMEELVRFASDRKGTTSAWLQRVVIAHRIGKFPSADLIRRLGEHVPVVDVRVSGTLPTDLV